MKRLSLVTPKAILDGMNNIFVNMSKEDAIAKLSKVKSSAKELYEEKVLPLIDTRETK